MVELKNKTLSAKNSDWLLIQGLQYKLLYKGYSMKNQMK